MKHEKRWLFSQMISLIGRIWLELQTTWWSQITKNFQDTKGYQLILPSIAKLIFLALMIHFLMEPEKVKILEIFSEERLRTLSNIFTKTSIDTICNLTNCALNMKFIYVTGNRLLPDRNIHLEFSVILNLTHTDDNSEVPWEIAHNLSRIFKVGKEKLEQGISSAILPLIKKELVCNNVATTMDTVERNVDINKISRKVPVLIVLFQLIMINAD